MLITLLTDFGTADYFVGAMKGVILTRAPQATILDLTHDIPPQDVRAGAFTLLALYREFPRGTVHVAVVDPGVGSARRPILVQAGEQLFVGPDNGLFSYVYDHEPDVRVLHLTDPRHFRSPVSDTFHGRDIFAAVAGSLAAGAEPAAMGEEVDDYSRLEPLVPVHGPDGELEGAVLHVDHFGNCITNFTHEHLEKAAAARGFLLTAGGREIRTMRRFFAEAGGEEGDPFVLWGSAGFLEIAVNRGSAARLLGIRAGDPVRLRVE